MKPLVPIVCNTNLDVFEDINEALSLKRRKLQASAVNPATVIMTVADKIFARDIRVLSDASVALSR